NALKRSTLGSKRNRSRLIRLLTLKSTWLRRGVISVPGEIRGTLYDAWFIPGITKAPTVHPAAAELPGQLVYSVVGVTVNTVLAPVGVLRLGFVVVENPP